MKDGLIEMDTKRGRAIGFTSDKFRKGSYLWLSKGYVYISFIVSLEPGKGNLSKLFKNIQKRGYGIKVPTPFARMEAIVKSHEFKKTAEYSKEMSSEVEVWVKERL